MVPDSSERAHYDERGAISELTQFAFPIPRRRRPTVDIVQETGATPAITYLRTRGVDEALANSQGEFYLVDALGSAVALTDAIGSVTATYTYEPFGRGTTSGTTGNHFEYTGRERDATELYYYRARYYHPQFQRFISEDPVGFAGGDINLFAYVRNSPVSFVDPSGLRLCRMDILGLSNALIDDSIALALSGFIGKNIAQGISVSFNNTFRPTEEQAALPGNPNAVTPAPPNTSLHEAGFAFDLNWNSIPPSARAAVRANATAVGFSWGGSFVPTPDERHFYREVPGGPANRGAYIDNAQVDAKCGKVPDCSAALNP